MLELSDEDRRILREVEAELHAEGWADFVTLERQLDGWRRLTGELNTYGPWIDDYTNDLYSREALKRILNRCPEPLRSRLSAEVQQIDDEFVAASVLDEHNHMLEFHAIEDMPGFWWRRIPRSGPLADYLHAEDEKRGIT